MNKLLMTTMVLLAFVGFANAAEITINCVRTDAPETNEHRYIINDTDKSIHMILSNGQLAKYDIYLWTEEFIVFQVSRSREVSNIASDDRLFYLSTNLLDRMSGKLVNSVVNMLSSRKPDAIDALAKKFDCSLDGKKF